MTFLSSPVSAKLFLYLTNCMGNPQNGPWIGKAFYDLPSAPMNLENPYGIVVVVIGAAEAAAWSWEDIGGGADMGSWRVSYNINAGAHLLDRGMVAGNGTKTGDAGRPGGVFGMLLLFYYLLCFY